MPVSSYRSIKSKDGNAAVLVGTSDATLTAGSDAAVFVGAGLGTSINGKTISFNANPLQMQFASMSVLNPIALLGIPSTLATPIPTFIFQIPGASTAAYMAVSVGIMMAFYGATTAAVGAVS